MALLESLNVLFRQFRITGTRLDERVARTTTNQTDKPK